MTTNSGDDRDLHAWFEQRMPDNWSKEPPEISVDGDQVTVSVLLDPADVPETMPAKARKKTHSRQLVAWRKRSRKKRDSISDEARKELGLNVAWAATVEGQRRSFTGRKSTIRVRLEDAEEETLAAMVSGGAATSKKEAAALCIRIAERHPDEWQGAHRAPAEDQ